MASKKKSVTLTFSKDRETKNTVRYEQDGDMDNPIMLYLPKSEVAKLGDPDSISVTVAAA